MCGHLSNFFYEETKTKSLYKYYLFVLIKKSQQYSHVTEFILSDDCSTCFGYHYYPFLCSWRWVIMIPETCRAIVRKINSVTCASCWDFNIRIWTNNFGTCCLATFAEQMKHWKESKRYNWLVLYNFRVSTYMLHPCEERIFRITTTYEWALTLCNHVHVTRLFSEACHSASASPANLRA